MAVRRHLCHWSRCIKAHSFEKYLYSELEREKYHLALCCELSDDSLFLVTAGFDVLGESGK